MSDLKERLYQIACCEGECRANRIEAWETIAKLEEELKDAKSFAKRCADSPVGQMIKQLDAVRKLPAEWRGGIEYASGFHIERIASLDQEQCADELQQALEQKP